MADTAVRLSALSARSRIEERAVGGRRGPADSERRTRSERVVTTRLVGGIALAIAATATALGLHAHAMWFDELQAWNIARASHSLPGLVANLRYEGHPVLWYLPLYALTRVTGDPRWMQALQLIVVVATYALVLFRSPFALP